jgi:3-oxoadipate enol-lactonase
MSKPVLNWVQQGHGPIVVLSHALGCTLGMWDEVAARLTSDYTVLRYDHRGHGQSQAPAGPYRIAMLADDAAGLIADRALGPVHFVGLSLGGMTAQALAAGYPGRVRSAVIANSANWYDDAARAMWQARIAAVRTQGVPAIADGAMQRWFTADFRAGKAGAARVAQMRADLEQTDADPYIASCEAIAAMDLRADNRRIACPALVIAGTLDEATPPALSEEIAAGIDGAQLETIAAAHLSAVEQPEAFSALLREFFQAQGG